MPSQCVQTLRPTAGEFDGPSRTVTIVGWVAGLLVLSLVLGVFGANWYTSAAYGRVKPGMTIAQVDRELSKFGRETNDVYNARRPGDTVIDYELLGLGKWTTITVVFDSTGTARDVIPVLSN